MRRPRILRPAEGGLRLEFVGGLPQEPILLDRGLDPGEQLRIFRDQRGDLGVALGIEAAVDDALDVVFGQIPALHDGRHERTPRQDTRRR